jgi:purine-binding chemotaxis protein CheW
VTGVQAVLLPVGSDLYAVPVDWVRQVMLAPPVTQLLTAPSLVLGLFNLRGEIVPMLDTAVLLGLPRLGQVAYALVVQSRTGPAALAATAFPRRATLDPPPAPSELPGTAGIYRLGRQVVALLDPAVLVINDRLDEQDLYATNGAGAA